jgi:hypothetical protein
MIRLTETDKWSNDDWFMGLKPLDKLLFIFIYENCDDAGFINIERNAWQQKTGMTDEQISGSLECIEKALLFNGKKSLWLKKFLFYQGKLPLNPKDPEHTIIANKLQVKAKEFSNNVAILELLSNQKSRRAKKEFNAPSVEEFTEYALKNHGVAYDDAYSLYSHYMSVGWVVGKGKKMKDWKWAIDRNFKGKPKAKLSRGDIAQRLLIDD